MPILRAEGLQKTYKGRKVVNGVSVEIAPGEIVGLLGPNGAGKTTSFYMMVGLVKPDGGRVRLDDHDITRLPMYRRAHAGIGYLAQEPSAFRGLTAEQNIMLVLEMLPGLSAASGRSGWKTCCGSLDMAPRVTRWPGSFRAVSGGASRSPASWQLGLRLSCWTSHLPAWTPSPLRTCRRSSTNSRRAASAS